MWLHKIPRVGPYRWPASPTKGPSSISLVFTRPLGSPLGLHGVSVQSARRAERPLGSAVAGRGVVIHQEALCAEVHTWVWDCMAWLLSLMTRQRKEGSRRRPISCLKGLSVWVCTVFVCVCVQCVCVQSLCVCVSVCVQCVCTVCVCTVSVCSQGRRLENLKPPDNPDNRTYSVSFFFSPSMSMTSHLTTLPGNVPLPWVCVRHPLTRTLGTVHTHPSLCGVLPSHPQGLSSLRVLSDR